MNRGKSKNNRQCVRFTDTYNDEAAVWQSSVYEDRLNIGDENGWHSRITREQAAALAEYLKHWADTGQLFEESEVKS